MIHRRTAFVLAAMVLAPMALGGLVYVAAPLGMLPGNYHRVLTSPLYQRLLGETFKLAGICAVGSLILGYPVAWGLRLAAERLRHSPVAGSLGPVLVNVIVRSLGWLVVIGEFGLLNLVLRTLRLEADLTRGSRLAGELAELGSLAQVFFPFMVLALYGAVAKIDLVLIRAARNLGASPLRAFFEVVVPLSLPGAAVGVVTVFALATGAYVTVAVFGGARVRAMAQMAYEESSTLVDWQLGAAVLVVLGVSAAILVRLMLAGLRRGGA